MKKNLLFLLCSIAVLSFFIPEIGAENFIIQLKDEFLSGQSKGVSLQTLIREATGINPDHYASLASEEQLTKWRQKGRPEVAGRLSRLITCQFSGIGENPYLLELLKRHPLIEFAEPDYRLQGTNIPDDPSYSLQWGLDHIEAPLAWDTTTGSEEVIVAVLDTGIELNHPDFQGNLIAGYDYVNNDGIPADDSAPTYHGTHIAGIIGARGNNGIGGSGVAWRVKIMPLKVLDSSIGGSVSNAVKAIDYAILANVEILNMSFGMESYSQALYEAIERARNAGILVITAAGNGGSDRIGDDTDILPFYPAAFDLDNIISVANIDANDTLSGSSNYGAMTVDLAAPGVSIYSTAAGSDYRYSSGTSMAAPFVSGAAALLLSKKRTASYGDIKSLLLENVIPVSSLTGKVVSGGKLSVFKALSAIPGEQGILGDVNDDGVVDMVDALMIARYYIRFRDPGFNILNGDITGDGVITILDALKIAQIVVGL